MSLRSRLVLALAAMLAVSLVLAGVALVGLTRQSLAEGVDRELVAIASASDRFRRLPDIAGENEAGRRVAVMRLDRRGAIQRAFPSGFASDPDPLPELPVYPDGIPSSAFDTIETRTAADGSVAYRVIMARGPAGSAVAVAAPLTGVEEATRALVQTLLIVGALALVVLVVLAWVILRRGLRPLEQLEGAARAITAGDLSHRTGIPHDQTEVGRVGAAFDTMVDQLEAGFASQQAALDAKARSEERLRRFVADASHELRTPLTAVRGYADLYRAGGLADPGALEAAMERIGTEGRRMALLVDDLLLLARLDQGRPLRADPVDLSRVARDAVTDARALEPARPITDDVEPAISITGDEDRIRQVVGNLLANVRVHTPADAPLAVVLRALPAEGAAELRVIDRGPGIAEEHAPHVFDRFYRADPGRSRERGGSGLGLSIVASITHALGGQLWHEPTPGGGATFVLRLPLTASSQPDRG
ncbi:MAG TPA: HAMP domain-containing sensor histidine kinase [Candidatus Limnocylindrales bacterium]|nr:HAMP domain-containing sensor histidine kinase [Candidatus Limnocylindrales bacterium]